ncbi:MAG TPA: hypothetical protein VM537_13600 [Anaerolineae bacterium]|nr:hypothetical protein [Anaerolineae bacterium]
MRIRRIIGFVLVAGGLALACTPPAITQSPATVDALTPAAAPTLPPEATVEHAGDESLAHVLFVKAQLQSGGSWSVDVTVEHEDIGWDHYADRWEVLAPADEILTTRVLAHPHVDEQPFTRSLGEIAIPPDISEVRVRAHDLVHGYGGRGVAVDLTASGGADFEVLR